MTEDSLDQWFERAPERFNAELAQGLDLVCQIHATDAAAADFHCTVAHRTLTIARGVHPSPSLTVRGDAAKLARLLTGNHEVLNSLIPMFPEATQVVFVTPHDPQLLMLFILLFQQDAVADYRKVLVGNIEDWSFYRDFWRPHLEQRGLLASHTLLDVGCGTLRVGGPIISYLDAGKYCGVDIKSEAIAEAKKELVVWGLEAKNPELVYHADIRALALGRTFDWILCASLFINLYDETLSDVLGASARHLHPEGRITGQVVLTDNNPDFSPDINWMGRPLIIRSQAFYETAAANNGLRISKIEPWGNQSILTFQHR